MYAADEELTSVSTLLHTAHVTRLGFYETVA